MAEEATFNQNTGLMVSVTHEVLTEREKKGNARKRARRSPNFVPPFGGFSND